VALAAACGHPSPPSQTPSAPGPVTLRTLPLKQLYVLEASGIPASDTSVTIPTRQRRVILLLHAPPDNSVFAEITFTPESFTAGDSVRITARVRPGVYGIDLECSQPIGRGGSLRFKYPVHFSAPLGAVQRYGSAVLFERELVIAHETGDSTYALLASTRPAADNLAAPLAGTGTYLVVAPR